MIKYFLIKYHNQITFVKSFYNGFACMKCGNCNHEYHLAFSCKRCHFGLSFQQKRIMQFREWLNMDVLKRSPTGISSLTSRRSCTGIFPKYFVKYPTACRAESRKHGNHF
jgi:hypothetical protein